MPPRLKLTLGRKYDEMRWNSACTPAGAHGMVSEMAQQTASASALGRNVAGFFRSGSGLSRAAWRVLRGAGVLVFAALAIFHLSLFWDRFVDGQLLDPLVAARWLAAGGISVALIALWRCGVSLVTGRRALVVWLLVVLLHWTARPAVVVADAGQPSTSELIFVVPATAAAALVGLGLLVAMLGASRVRPALPWLCTMEPSDAGRTASGWRPATAARAPPFRFV